MKRFVLSALSFALLAGCSSAPSAATPTVSPDSETVSVPEGLKILSPSGAPSYALVPLAKEGNQELTIVDGSDALQAAFVNPDMNMMSLLLQLTWELSLSVPVKQITLLFL